MTNQTIVNVTVVNGRWRKFARSVRPSAMGIFSVKGRPLKSNRKALAELVEPALPTYAKWKRGFTPCKVSINRPSACLSTSKRCKKRLKPLCGVNV
jgi:hypothetical protein